MCCLKYEQDQYVETKRIAPRNSSTVITPRGEATVLDVNLLTEAVTVRLLGDESDDLYRYQIDELDYNKPARKRQPEVAKKNEEEPVKAVEAEKSEDASCCASSCSGGCPSKTRNLSEDDESVVVASSLPTAKSAKVRDAVREGGAVKEAEADVPDKDDQTPAPAPKQRRRRIGKPATPGFIPHMISPEDLPKP